MANQDILQNIADLGEVAHPFPQQEDMAEEVEVEVEAIMEVAVTMWPWIQEAYSILG